MLQRPLDGLGRSRLGPSTFLAVAIDPTWHVHTVDEVIPTEATKHEAPFLVRSPLKEPQIACSWPPNHLCEALFKGEKLSRFKPREWTSVPIKLRQIKPRGGFPDHQVLWPRAQRIFGAQLHGLNRLLPLARKVPQVVTALPEAVLFKMRGM